MLFAHSLEKIKLKQIEEEYFKLVDAHLPKDGGGGISGGAGGSGGGNELVTSSGPPPNKVIAGLYIPTPDSVELKMHEAANVPSLVDGSRSDASIRYHPSYVNVVIVLDQCKKAIPFVSTMLKTDVQSNQL